MCGCLFHHYQFISVISLRDKLPSSLHPYLYSKISAFAPVNYSDWLDCWQAQLSILCVCTLTHISFRQQWWTFWPCWLCAFNVKRSEIIEEEEVTWRCTEQDLHELTRQVKYISTFMSACLRALQVNISSQDKENSAEHLKTVIPELRVRGQNGSGPSFYWTDQIECKTILLNIEKSFHVLLHWPVRLK